MVSLLERLERIAERDDSVPDARRLDPVGPVLKRVQESILSTCPDLVLVARGDQQTRSRLESVILQVIVREGLSVPGIARGALAEALVQEIAGFGPIDPLIADATVSEVMVNGPRQIYIERSGVLELTDVVFKSDEHLVEVISRIVAPLGRRIDTACPYVDARLPDGSRVNAIVPPLALNGPILTVRKFPDKAMALEELVRLETLSAGMAEFLHACVRARLNIIISGGAGSGKTTTLNALCSLASPGDRVITLEDAAELRIRLPHVVSLESRPANIEGKGCVTIRDLLRNALRMRPDRLIIGEVRGAEAYDLLQALNTGHQGCMSTVHANGVGDALRRLENMVLLSGETVPHEVVSEELRSAVDLLIHQQRMTDGSRRITDVSIVDKAFSAGERRGPVLRQVFRWVSSSGAGAGRFEGCALTGVAPETVFKFRQAGIAVPAWLGGERE
ncbi:MAG: CpaF family protein [Firmicutes bacterium]|nr:CpaF family protein [Bacillota bacterium]